MRITAKPGTPLVRDPAIDAVVPRRFTAEDDGLKLGSAEGSFAVKMEVEVTPGMRGRCREIAVKAEGDEPITGDALRLPLALMVREAVGAASSLQRADGVIWPDDAAAIYQRVSSEPRRPLRGSHVTDDELKEVARIYMEALSTGDHPTLAVEMGGHPSRVTPRSTASRWIRLARDRGFLGPASPGKAG